MQTLRDLNHGGSREANKVDGAVQERSLQYHSQVMAYESGNSRAQASDRKNHQQL